MNRRIYLIRHGKIDCEKEKCYIGITDLPLSNEGIEQAHKLKEYFSRIEIEKVFVSPLKRCLQTAGIILENRNIGLETVDAVKEINMGQWEGLSFANVRSCFPELYDQRGYHMDTFIPPGGESFRELQNRVMPAFISIAGNTAGNVLIVAHAGVNRVILSKLMNTPLCEIMNIYQPYGCINSLSWDETHLKWNHETIC